MHKGAEQKREVELPEGFLWMAAIGALGWCGARVYGKKSVVPRLSSVAVDPGMITGVCHGRWAREVMKSQISAGRSGTASAFWCAASGAYLLFLI